MGREAKVTKDRTCRNCEQVFNITAKELKSHAKMCKQGLDIKARMDALGLINPFDTGTIKI